MTYALWSQLRDALDDVVAFAGANQQSENFFDALNKATRLCDEMAPIVMAGDPHLQTIQFLVREAQGYEVNLLCAWFGLDPAARPDALAHLNAAFALEGEDRDAYIKGSIPNLIMRILVRSALIFPSFEDAKRALT